VDIGDVLYTDMLQATRGGLNLQTAQLEDSFYSSGQEGFGSDSELSELLLFDEELLVTKSAASSSVPLSADAAENTDRATSA
jgi:hypothetical protein